ncbi:MAG: 5-formyltetrahydrofolate cyclo-ligase [Pseudomonadota bacterium]
MTTLTEEKAAARKAAFARRKAAHGPKVGDRAAARLLDFLQPHAGKIVAGYWPIYSEADPRPVLHALATKGPVCLPVIEGRDQPLSFRQWKPDARMVEGPFGAMVPAEGRVLTPEVLIVPLVAFDAQLFRLGYGGGFYDRTLSGLRAGGDALAIGFAYAAQRSETLPTEPTDEPLDAIVTEAETHHRGAP